jgi:hypothetical protein
MMSITVMSAMPRGANGNIVAASSYAVGIAAETADAATLQKFLQPFLAKPPGGVWTNAYFGPWPLVRFPSGGRFSDVACFR